ncbi:amidase [Variovorax sp. OK605]|uniref:AtzE family amidohydrolase n=1 Tax=unclassified Variovorax TaxID=663243 RepID=UPI0008AD81B1|nr:MULTISPECIES: AtzE family amidohydrolase [unclassified Variovorax]SEJ87253.1 amidase/aspartyl-tRNA(Asn)/glutamyl-tRNA(Gln) amidotransferase subunit A [Variovorax sp. OK202]SFD03045.1 amidase/aspartyl-tRNA(Asn)/glutamyl-tRNA(Gln) amidotransferase subunit A [Variovorax sp. OK212]SFP15964.1 amidase [Variovorax sp. OK605]
MSAAELLGRDACAMADAVRAGTASATALVQASLARVDATDDRVNAFTSVLSERALRRAAQVDASLASANGARTRELPLLGVPFAVKNLFDIAGLPTLAGSKIEHQTAPARADAALVRRLERAGAVLVGALNMDEYAYGFTTENSHEGPTRNPHDLTRIAGGSSGGSGAAVAAGQVPLTLGSDTNGSIRVPASLCGVFGLKPTFGRLPRTGSFPFVSSLDHLGPFARSARDLARVYDAMQGPEEAGGPHDPGCAQRAAEPVSPSLGHGTRGLRVGVLGGYFRERAGAEASAAVDRVAEALGAIVSPGSVELPMVEAGRAAAFLITNAEGAALHLADLRRRAHDFEPLSRDRFLAGALLPAAWVSRAQRVRLAYAEAVARLFGRYDILLAPATPSAATPIGAETFEVNGHPLPVRPNMGLLTQPFSCIGLPVCAVPVWGAHANLPIGVQVIGAPWREDLVLRVAAALEAAGVAHAPVAALTPEKTPA